MPEQIEIKIKKRSWYEWLLWALWFVLVWFTFQNALASSGELEPRAAAIFWVMFAVLLVGGLVVWFMRRAR